MTLKDFATLAVLGAGAVWGVGAAAQSTPETFPGLTIQLEDSITMPVLGKLEGATTPNESAIARVNGIKEETGGSHRLFLPVVSGPILIYDKKTKAFTTYLDFNGFGESRGLFKKFFTISGYGNGVNGFTLDPDYAKNGKFYTTHMEDPSIEAPGGPQNTMFPGLQTSGYTTTAPITTPGPVMHQGVLVEWTTRTRRITRLKEPRGKFSACGSTRAAISSAKSFSIRQRSLATTTGACCMSTSAMAPQANRKTPRCARIRSGSTRWSAKSCASFPTSTSTPRRAR